MSDKKNNLASLPAEIGDKIKCTDILCSLIGGEIDNMNYFQSRFMKAFERDDAYEASVGDTAFIFLRYLDNALAHNLNLPKLTQSEIKDLFREVRYMYEIVQKQKRQEDRGEKVLAYPIDAGLAVLFERLIAARVDGYDGEIPTISPEDLPQYAQILPHAVEKLSEQVRGDMAKFFDDVEV